MSINKRLQTLARRQCATFDTTTQDRCLLDCQCVFFRQEDGRCRYFEAGVLPTDAKLERDYKAERGLGDEKKAVCSACGAPFERTGGRQVYCKTCGGEQARKARNKRAREHRASKRDSNALNG
jgi:DNA-directed RNA polymerase subunit RPC12/RpoP